MSLRVCLCACLSSICDCLSLWTYSVWIGIPNKTYLINPSLWHRARENFPPCRRVWRRCQLSAAWNWSRCKVKAAFLLSPLYLLERVGRCRWKIRLISLSAQKVLLSEENSWYCSPLAIIAVVWVLVPMTTLWWPGKSSWHIYEHEKVKVKTKHRTNGHSV